jgi:hypothetical protein
MIKSKLLDTGVFGYNKFDMNILKTKNNTIYKEREERLWHF